MAQPADRPGTAQSSTRAATLRIKRGAKTLSEIPLGRARLVVGGGQSAQLRLKNAGLPEECVILDLRAEEFAVESRLGPDQVFMNGWALNGRSIIRAGDRLEFSGITLELLDAEGKAGKQLPTSRDSTMAIPSAKSQPPARRPQDEDADPYMGKQTAAKVLISEIERARSKIEERTNSRGVPAAGSPMPAAPPVAVPTLADDPRAVRARGPIPSGAPAGPTISDDPAPSRSRRGPVVGAVEEISLAAGELRASGFAKPPWLEAITDNGSTDARLYLLRNGVTAGRQGDLRVQHASVSKKHACFQVREGKLWVEDLGSTNGVWVNRERVSAKSLVDGDTLHLGAVEFRVKIPDAVLNELRNLGSPARPPEEPTFGPELSSPQTATGAAPRAKPPNGSADPLISRRDPTLRDGIPAARNDYVTQPERQETRRDATLRDGIPAARADSFQNGNGQSNGFETRRDSTLRDGVPAARAPIPAPPVVKQPQVTTVSPPSREPVSRDAGTPPEGFPEARGGRAPARGSGMSLDPREPSAQMGALAFEGDILELETPDPARTRAPAPSYESPTLDRPAQRRDRSEAFRVQQQTAVAVPQPMARPQRSGRGLGAMLGVLVVLLLAGGVGVGGFFAWPQIQAALAKYNANPVAKQDPLYVAPVNAKKQPVVATNPKTQPHLEPTPDRRIASLDRGTLPVKRGSSPIDDEAAVLEPLPTPTATPALRLGQELFGNEKVDITGQNLDVARSNLEQGAATRGLRNERTIGVDQLKTIYIDEGSAIVRRQLADDGFGMAPSAADDTDAEDRKLGAKQIDTKKVNALIRGRFDDVKKCLVGSSGFKGGKARVVVQFTLNPNGKTSDMRLIESDIKGAKFDGCVTSVVKKISFPKPKSQSVIVQFPFVFFYN